MSCMHASMHGWLTQGVLTHKCEMTHEHIYVYNIETYSVYICLLYIIY